MAQPSRNYYELSSIPDGPGKRTIQVMLDLINTLQQQVLDLQTRVATLEKSSTT